METSEQWVTTCVFADRCFQQPPAHDDSFINQAALFAQKHGLAPLLYGMTLKNPNDAATALNQKLKPSYLNATLRHTRLTHAYHEICQQLAQMQVPHIPLKGIYLSQKYYPDPAYRQMSDIDILVPKTQMEKVFETLSGSPHHIDLLPSDHHLSFRYKDDCMVEVHRYLNSDDVRYRIPTEDIWQRATPLEPSGLIMKMDPAQLMVYLPIHMYYNIQRGGFRLNWFNDLRLVAEQHPELKPDDLGYWLKKWKVEKPFTSVVSLMGLVCEHKLPSVLRPWDKQPGQRQADRLFKMIADSWQQELSMSYQVAWERLVNTKGWRAKLTFAKSKLAPHGERNIVEVTKRLAHLTSNTLRMLSRKRMGKGF